VEIAQQCAEQKCERCSGSGAAADLQHMCLSHFIVTCYEKLEQMARSTHTWSVGGPAWESARRFTMQCKQIATNFPKQNSGLSNLERARLTDIAIWATELGRCLRRSPRSPFAIPIRLISEMPGRSWVEETYTVDVDRHGARTRCQNVVKNGDILKIFRPDTGEQEESRVVWQQKLPSGGHEIGIEFLGAKNFWDPVGTLSSK
jgi:hypothetical protein